MSFAVEGRAADQIVGALGARGINASTSTLNSTRLDMAARGLSDLVRASVHYDNAEDEVARFTQELAALL